MTIDLENIQKFYEKLPERLSRARQRLDRPMTYAEKIVWSHALSEDERIEGAPELLIPLQPDRIVLTDINSQLALLQLASISKNRTMVPVSLHCDHYIQAEQGLKEDLLNAQQEHREIYEFLELACRKFGIDFWRPGSGTSLQVFLENYAFPGGLLLGSDFYLPNAGGMGMMAIMTGPSDLVGAMVGIACEVPHIKPLAIYLFGRLQGWASPKDVALKLLEILSIDKYQPGTVIELMGEGAESLSCTGKATICNLLAESGALTALFPYDASMADFLAATQRKEVAVLADSAKMHLRADSEVIDSPQSYFQNVFELDLGTVEPRVCGPKGSEVSWELTEFAAMVRQHGFPEELAIALIGSSVNSSYEDMGRACSIARQAWKHGLKAKSTLMILPGSDSLREKAEADGLLKVFREIGGICFASACGPCAGLWKRHDVTFGEKNSIVTTFNRPFPGRHDGSPGTFAFSTSPEIAMAMALAGKLTFNPLTDALITAQGLPVRFDPPTGAALPEGGFDRSAIGYVEPAQDGLDVPLTVDSDSKRLQMLTPLPPWNERDFVDMRVLVKAAAKTHQEQLFPGGRWQRFRGHIDNLTDGIYLNVGNAFRAEIGKGKNLLTGEVEPFPKIARDYKKEGVGWLFIAEENCGEGHGCEITALAPRYLGCKAVIAKSYGRNYEHSLKHQGILALTLTHWEDFARIREDDLIDIEGIRELAPENQLELLLKHADGSVERVALNHSYTPAQAVWFKAGSALNASRG